MVKVFPLRFKFCSASEREITSTLQKSPVTHFSVTAMERSV